MAQHEPHQVCPESTAFLIAKKLIALGDADAGVAILLLYDTYIRAFGLKALKISDAMILRKMKVNDLIMLSPILRKGKGTGNKPLWSSFCFRHDF